MDHTPHIFLSGEEAERFAQQQGHPLVDNSTFTTQQRKEQWQKYRDEERLAPHDEIVQEVATHTQTVGAVAIDCNGRLAAATSTGGRTNKWDGRIGDTPMIGAGKACYVTTVVAHNYSPAKVVCISTRSAIGFEINFKLVMP